MSKSSRNWLQRQLTAGEKRGTIGKVDSSTGGITYTTSDGMYWWITLEDSTVIAAINSITGYNRTDVIVKPLPDGTWVVDRLQTKKVWQVFGNTISSLLTPPHTHHSNGPTPDTTQTRMLLDGLVQTRSGDPALTVYVNPFNYKDASTADKFFAGDTFDLTSYIPGGSGTKAPVKIGFDPAAGTLVAAAGTAVSVLVPLGRADVALIAFTGYIPLSAVVLSHGQTTVPVEADFIDCGIIRNNSSGNGSSPLTTKGDLYGYDSADARIPVGVDGLILKADSTQTLGVKWDSVSAAATGYILIEDQKSSGTNGGTFTSGAWRTRDLTTIVTDTTGAVTLGSNQFVLPAGTYRANIICPAYAVEGHQARLQNITDSATVAVGQNSYARSSAAAGFFVAAVICRFTIAGAKTFEVQHQCQTTQVDGFGFSLSFGTEVYTVVELIKE